MYGIDDRQSERISSIEKSLIHSTLVAVLTSGRHFWLTRPAPIFNCPCSLLQSLKRCIVDSLSQRP